MAGVIVVAGIAGAIWGAWLLRRTGLVGGCVMVLLVGSVFGHSFFHVNVGGMPVTADRILLVVLVAIFAGAWWIGRLPRRPWTSQDTVVLAFSLIPALSILVHGGTSHTVAHVLVFYFMPLTVYMVLRGTTLTTTVVNNLFVTFALFGFYLAMTAVLERQQLTALIFPRYLVTSDYTEFLGRGRGPFLNPAGNGLYMITGLVALWSLWPRVNRMLRAVIVVATPCFFAGVAATMTRSVWAALAVAVLLVVICVLPRRWGIAFALTATIMGAMVVGVKWHDLNAFKRDKHVSVSEMAESARLRPILATIAWKMFLDRPLFGCGLGQYREAAVDYLADRSTALPLQKARNFVQHNIVLSLLVETGLIGASLLVMVLAIWFRDAWLIWARGPDTIRWIGLLSMSALSVYVTVGMFQDLTIVPMANLLIYLLGGVVRIGTPSSATAGSQPATLGQQRETPSWQPAR